MKKILLLLLLVMSVSIMTSCVTEAPERDVFVTVYPLQYVVEEIFQGTEYTVGMVPGISAHNEAIDWSPKEIIAMMDAKLLFYVGANFDTYIDSQISQIFTDANVELVKAENTLVEFIPGLYHDHDVNEHSQEEIDAEEMLGTDPHFWISPKRMITVAGNVYLKLQSKFPGNEETFTENYNKLMTDLADLDAAFTEVIAAAVRPVMTATNLYSYLSSDYALEYIPISPGYHEETDQFTTQQKEAVVNEAVEHNITNILFERNSSSPLSNAVLASLVSLGYNVSKLEYTIMDTLTKDDINNNRNYLSIMYDNLDMIQSATSD